MRTIKDLVRGDRFVTRDGRLGHDVQDYFVVQTASTSDRNFVIYCVTANGSSNATAKEHELKVPSWSSGFTEIWEENGRWRITWPGKSGGPDETDSVEFPTACLLCDGVRSVSNLHEDPLCIDCRHITLGDRICDCAAYGQHIPVICDQCGGTYSTKNISHIGARHIHGIYEDSCGCEKGWYFHDCRGKLFVKGTIVDGKFVAWIDKYKETK